MSVQTIIEPAKGQLQLMATIETGLEAIHAELEAGELVHPWGLTTLTEAVARAFAGEEDAN